jgi:HK97 family phage major capsid protein
MATATTPAAGEARGLTQAELKAELLSTAKEALGPIVEAAIAPFTKAQTDLASHLTLISKGPESTVPDHVKLDAALGKWPIGRKILALAMSALDSKTTFLDPDRAIHAIKAATGSPDRGRWPLSMAEPTIKWLQFVKTSLTAGNPSVAGDMVMPVYDPEWIDLLRNNAVVRSIARTLPMPRGATSRRKQTGAGTAAYQGETERIQASNQTIGREALSYKKLTAMTIISNDLIRFSSGEADRFVQEDLLKVLGLREDRAFLTGNPPTDAGSPKGIRYYTAATNVYASAGTSLANFQADLTKAIRLVQAANVPATPQNSYFLMSASTFWTIYALTTTTGDWIFASGLEQRRLFGFPILITTQLEVTNSWIGASGGMVIFCHAPSLEIHDSMSRTITVHPHGAYYDHTLAAVVSGISNDETVITCIAEHDFFQVYDVAASVITGYAT